LVYQLVAPPTVFICLLFYPESLPVPKMSGFPYGATNWKTGMGPEERALLTAYNV
jgi:hypothetical protein